MKKIMNFRQAKTLLATLAVTAALAPSGASAMALNTSAGGTFTFNYDSAALGQAAYGNVLGNNGYYLAKFWDTAASDPSDSANVASNFTKTHVGSTQISATNLVHDLTAVGSYQASQPSGRHVQGTSSNFSIESTDLSGVSGAQLGMTGIQGFYIPNFATTVSAGDFSLAYNPTETASGWYIKNNLSFGLITYDLANLALTVTDANNWQLNGDLLFAADYAGMIYGQAGSKVGTFSLDLGSYAVTAVPVPGAVWLFGSALAGLLGFNRRKAV